MMRQTNHSKITQFIQMDWRKKKEVNSTKFVCCIYLRWILATAKPRKLTFELTVSHSSCAKAVSSAFQLNKFVMLRKLLPWWHQISCRWKMYVRIMDTFSYQFRVEKFRFNAMHTVSALKYLINRMNRIIVSRRVNSNNMLFDQIDAHVSNHFKIIAISWKCSCAKWKVSEPFTCCLYGRRSGINMYTHFSNISERVSFY